MSVLLCFECGSNSELHMHHVVPKSLGGTKVVPLCVVCHGKVHDRDFMHHRALTIAGLKKAKDRGITLGNPNLKQVRNNDTSKATEARVKQTSERNSEILEIINELMAKHGNQSSRQLARLLNDSGYTTARGKAWSGTQVWRIMKT